MSNRLTGVGLCLALSSFVHASEPVDAKEAVGHIKITSSSGLLLVQPIVSLGATPTPFRVSRPGANGAPRYEVNVSVGYGKTKKEGAIFGNCLQVKTLPKGQRSSSNHPIRWSGGVESGRRSVSIGCPGMLVEVVWP